MNGIQGDGILPHTLIVLEENSRLVYIDEYSSSSSSSSSAPNAQPGAAYALSNAVVEIFLKRGAQLSYFNVQRWGSNVYHFLKQRIISEADSQLTSASVALGSKLTKSNIEAILNGSGASAQMLGILMGDLDQFFAHNTLQKHVAPSTSSDLLFKAALKDKSHSFFSGLIRVEKSAQKAGAYQLNTNLLLSDGAKATPIPRLEIETNEVVKCTHGATVGPVDDEQIFYLMTRGLDYKTAERMIVLGFFDQVLQRIPIKSAKQKLISHIERKLEGI
jgi:Fe-S cluster assembly protein SufD